MVRKVIAEVFFFFVVAAVAVVAEVGKAFFHILAIAERSFILIYTALMPVDRVLLHYRNNIITQNTANQHALKEPPPPPLNERGGGLMSLYTCIKQLCHYI